MCQGSCCKCYLEHQGEGAWQHTIKDGMHAQGGKLVLHWAAQFGHAELCKAILESLPLADFRDERGNTPLHLAACNDHR